MPRRKKTKPYIAFPWLVTELFKQKKKIVKGKTEGGEGQKKREAVWICIFEGARNCKRRWSFH